jgi:hypothetical protein
LYFTGKLLGVTALVSVATALQKAETSSPAEQYEVIEQSGVVILENIKPAKVELLDKTVTEIMANENVTQLRLQRVVITDRQLKTLLTLPKLKYLRLCEVEIRGEALENLPICPALERLDLYDATITETQLKLLLVSVPSSVASLNLSMRTKLSDAGVQGLKNLQQLKVLHLENQTKLSSVMVRSLLCSLTQLEQLNLSSTQVNEEALADITQLTQLKKLSLANTAITDSALRQVAKLKNLEELVVSKTKVTDAGILCVVDQCTLLGSLVMFRTPVTHNFVAGIRQKRPEINFMHDVSDYG